MRKKIFQAGFSLLIITSMILMFCGTAAAKQPKYGGKLRVVSGYSNFEPEAWDPNTMNWYIGAVFGGGIYQTLWWGDLSKGPRGTGECKFALSGYISFDCVTGSLSESWEFETPLTVLFKIRKGIYFPDKPGVMKSRELTAEDVVYSHNRFKFESGFPSPGNYDWMKKFEVVDRYTARLVMNNWVVNWWVHVTNRWAIAPIYPKELVKAGFKWQNVTGSGPWMLKNYVSGSSISYKRNPVYWEKAEINGKKYKLPFPDEFELLLIKDEMTRIAALQTGKIDLMENVQWEHKKTLAKTNPDLKPFKYTSGTVNTISLRMDKGPFKDIRVRRAAHMAFDNKAIMDTLWGGDGVLLSWPMKVSYPETMYTPLEKQSDIVKKMYGYHPEEAKKLLKAAGYPNGFTVDILAPNNMIMVDDILDYISAYWGAVGIQTKVRKYDYGPFMSLVGERNYDTLLMTRGANPPWTALEDVMTPGYVPWNSAIFDVPKVWDEIKKGRTSRDPKEQNRVLNWANIQYIELGGEIAMAEPYSYVYAWPHVKNYFGEMVRTPWNAAPIYARIWLDK